MTDRGFEAAGLDSDDVSDLTERALRCRGAILTMTTLAASGHPGGSMSSIEAYLVLYRYARLRPEEADWPGRDRIVVSHGHTSPGVYAALGDLGFFELEDAVAHFRQAGSPFEGHVERSVPGVEWSTGNLGQGLSAGVGMALAARLTDNPYHTFVAMSDAEQNKGQVAEARRVALKYGLCDLTVVVDLNRVQISGHTDEIMPVDVAADYVADGWRVFEVDGHDVGELYGAVAAAVSDCTKPCAILAHTTLGKGVSFMEDDPDFHGRGLTPDEYARAMAELGLDPCQLDRMRERRGEPVRTAPAAPAAATLAEPGSPRTYSADARTDNRSAFGTALADVAVANPDVPMAVFDCDLVTSVKTGEFAKARPEGFIECGVGEHNVAAAAGAASASGVQAWWADFGVFGLDEVYNQQRLNDINHAHLKLALTHCGLDVGEDGRTHQCIDYVGALRDFFGWKVIVPADPNQTDRAVREMAAMTGNVAVCMGRSKLPTVIGPDGDPAFGGDYRLVYGAIERLRDGGDATLLAMGTVVGAAVAASDLLATEGQRVAVDCVSCPLSLDDEAMERAVASPLVVTVEDHGVRTGLGGSVAEWLALTGRSARFVRLGVDSYRSSGTAHDLLKQAGLDAEGIAASLRSLL